jgi:hypothetical protein
MISELINHLVGYDLEARRANPNATPQFRIVEGNYVYDTINFEVVAYVKKTTSHPDFGDMTVEGVYLLKHKTKGTFFEYTALLFDSENWYHGEPKLRSLTKYEAQMKYKNFKDFPDHYYPNRHFNKTYEETFGKPEEY